MDWNRSIGLDFLHQIISKCWFFVKICQIPSENDGGKWVRSSLCDAADLFHLIFWMVWWLWYFCNKNTKNKQLNSNKPPRVAHLQGRHQPFTRWHLQRYRSLAVEDSPEKAWSVEGFPSMFEMIYTPPFQSVFSIVQLPPPTHHKKKTSCEFEKSQKQKTSINLRPGH